MIKWLKGILCLRWAFPKRPPRRIRVDDYEELIEGHISPPLP